MKMYIGKARRGVRAFTLIGTLVAVAIILILAAVLLPRYLGGKTLEGKTVRAPITVAKDAVCQTNLGSVRQSIQAFTAGDTDGKLPQALDELRELSSELKKCPVGGEPYQYNPALGSVVCPHPGHEAY